MNSQPSAPDEESPSVRTPATEVTPEATDAANKVAPDTSAGEPTESPRSDTESRSQPTRSISPLKARVGRRGIVIALLLLGLFLLGFLGLRWYLHDRPVPFTVEATDITIMVEEGDSARRVMAKLRENGLDVSPETMRLAARFSDIDLRRIHAGLYRFESGLSPVGILETIAKGALADQQLRIPDGAPIWEVMRLIRSHPGLRQTTADKSEAEIAALLGLETPSLEGWFAPDTYHFSGGTTDLTVMKVALKQQQDRLEKAWNSRTEDVQVTSLYEALILASIIEKETGHSADRHLISSVFNNRLRIRMPLQTDPTVIYGLGETFDGNLTRRQLQTASAYNTYKIQGLPPTPIAMPSPASLEAAMHPAKSQFLYFVSRGDGTSEFSTNLRDHNRAVQTYILKRRSTH